MILLQIIFLFKQNIFVNFPFVINNLHLYIGDELIDNINNAMLIIIKNLMTNINVLSALNQMLGINSIDEFIKPGTIKPYIHY